MDENWDIPLGWEMHGDALLLKHLQGRIFQKGTSWVEIGSGSSTLPLAQKSKELELNFVSVDLSSEYISLRQKLAEIDPNFKFMMLKGEDFLRSYTDPISIAYLDGYDTAQLGWAPPLDMQSRYKSIGGWAGNESSWQMHETCAKLVDKLLVSGGLICIDDNWRKDGAWSYRSKGRLALPYLISNGYKEVQYVHGAILLEKP